MIITEVIEHCFTVYNKFLGIRNLEQFLRFFLKNIARAKNSLSFIQDLQT